MPAGNMHMWWFTQRVMWLRRIAINHFSLCFTSHSCWTSSLFGVFPCSSRHFSQWPLGLHFLTETSFLWRNNGARINLKRPNGVEQQYRFYCRPNMWISLESCRISSQDGFFDKKNQGRFCVMRAV